MDENPTEKLERLRHERTENRREGAQLDSEVYEAERVVARAAANSRAVNFDKPFRFYGGYYVIHKKEGSCWMGDGDLEVVNVPNITPLKGPTE